MKRTEHNNIYSIQIVILNSVMWLHIEILNNQ